MVTAGVGRAVSSTRRSSRRSSARSAGDSETRPFHTRTVPSVTMRRARPRPPACAAGAPPRARCPHRADVPGDALGVAPGSTDEHRRERVQEGQACEVEARRRCNGAAVLHGIAVVADLVGEPDPAEVGPESGAPDHVPHVESATPIEHRQPVLDADDALENTLDTRALEVLAPVAEQRRSTVADVRAHLSTHRRVRGEDVRAREEEQPEAQPAASGLDRRRDLPRVLAGEHDVVLRRSLPRDVRAGVARANDENRSLLELREIPVVVRVELCDARIELGS